MSGESQLYQVNPELIGLDGSEAALFNDLLAVWGRHLAGNLRNERYYNARRRLHALGKELPDALRGLYVVSGWGAKAVDALAGRSVLKGFTAEGESVPELGEFVEANDLLDLYGQAVTSECIGSCAFLTLTAGLPGEPDVICTCHSASNAAALWDWRRKRIRAGIAVVDVTEDRDGTRTPSWVVMYTDEQTVSCRRLDNNHWSVERAGNALGRPLMEPLRLKPTLDRPFGQSRISRPVRSLVDRAIGVATRTEVSAEFYTWPQRYLLGVDKGTAAKMAESKMATYIDNMVLVTKNSEGDIPQYGQLSQMSMQPHTDHLQSLAKQFAGETSVPLSSLGIVFDNPSSAEAMYAAQNDLIIEAERLNRTNGRALRNVALMALASMRRTTIEGLGEEARGIAARFENPIRPSMAARADYAMKVASAVPAYAQTTYFWRDLGYDEEDVRGITRQVRQAEALASMAAPQASAQPPAAEAPTVSDGEGE